jgi:hypothetical protein
MKKVILILLNFVVITLIVASCKKEKPFESNAELTGYDLRMCPCCGGLEIKIDNIANPSGSGIFLVDSLPKSFILGNNPQFPIAVKVDYTIDSIYCAGIRVNINRIERR